MLALSGTHRCDSQPLFQLTVVKQKADDWVRILDHTCPLGNQKKMLGLAS